ncbi:Gfo/Idh/MocA family protein [Aquisphaera insulae]|uniref:Gfo/Idh/MocA family protein n=1 Tax=Aquisphaera insulae TaxID=2712864 RepID=UPI0013E9EEF8|nr:Gfo/Idh/MocA family oxidoreductase [Aquisphaera insulae]
MGMTRRRFSGTIAAGFLGGFAMPGIVLGRRPDDLVKIALVGVGGRGADNLGSVLKQEVVGLCDVDGIALENAAKRASHARTFRDFRRMFDEIHNQVDAVVVSTPDHTHAMIAHAAMELGKHVYCEKPLTHSIHEARVLAETAARKKVATQMGNGGHSSEATRRVVEIVRAGVIGPVREVHAWSDRPIWPQGVDRPADMPPVPGFLDWDAWLGPAPARAYNPAYHPFKWRGWWDFGTGALGDMGCHIIDASFWALDLGAPSSIEAESPPIKDHPDTAPAWSIVRYQFPAKGDRAAVKLTWYDGGKLPSAELFDGNPPGKGANGCLFVGEKGRLVVGTGKGGPRLLPEKDFADRKLPPATLPRSPGHHEEWLEACRNPARPTGTHFGYAGPLTEIVLLGNVALRAGRRIEWDAANMRVANGPLDDPYIRRDYRAGWTL